MFNPSLLPDVASQDVAEIPKPLQWVGMEEISVPVLIANRDKVVQQVAAKTALYVSLSQHDVKGIHMSRLHLALNQKLAAKELTLEGIRSLLEYMKQSQEGISDAARLVLDFDLVLEKPALLSDEFGFQSYPVRVDAQFINDELSIDLELTIPYSSTCPCSASLSRQALADAVNERFQSATIDKQELNDWIVSRAGSVATPHSQRSYAYLKLSLEESQWPSLAELIFGFESMIGTPVQTAVKRQDEQAFARLNAENLMFCEDAARRLKSGLEKMSFVQDYWFKVEHQESLHAHNAVVIDQRNPS